MKCINYLKRKKVYTIYIAVLSFSLFIYSCQKPKSKDEVAPEKMSLMSQNKSIQSTIKFSEIISKLPQTVLSALGDSLRFYPDKSQTFKTDSTITVRIPTTLDGNNYVYAIRRFNKPENLDVYLVKFKKDQESNKSSFTGKKVWLDVQNWSIYGIRYENNIPKQWLNPIKLANEGWEEWMIENGYFSVDKDGTLKVKETPTANRGPVDKFGCYDFGNNGSWFGNFIRVIGSIVKSAFTSEDGSEGGSISGVIFIPGGSNDGGLWGNNGSGYSDGANGAENGLGGSWTSDGNGVTNDLPDLTLNTAANYIKFSLLSTYPLTSEEYFFLLIGDPFISISIKQFLLIPPSTLGLTTDQKKALAKQHIAMLESDPNYRNEINSITGNWWDKDQNGFITARKIEMKLYLQAHPFTLIDCSDINSTAFDGHLVNWQQLATYSIPTTVQDRITSIRAQYPNIYTPSSFQLQNINDAKGGIVNCDFFALHINTLPYDSYGYTRMTPEQFLDFFRQNINTMNSLGDNTSTNYSYYNHAGYLNDYTRFYTTGNSSLASLAHFNNPSSMSANVVYNDGTVIESGYSQSTNHKWFIYSTMKSPLDGTHPVSGNRRFGIMPDASGGYLFYIRGVDRVTDYFTNTVNWALNAVFDGADDLWHSEIKGIKNYILQHGGNADYYPVGGDIRKRPKWNGPLGNYLKGQISLQQLKDALQCP